MKTFRQCEVVTDLGYGLEMHHCADIVTAWKGLSEYCYILHDKDLTEKDGQTVPRAHHIHMALKFNSPTPMNAIQARISKYIGKDCPAQWIENVHSTWAEIVTYETHHDPKSLENPLKHVYDYEEAFTNIDLEQIEQRADEARTRRKTHQEKEARFAEIMNAIDNDEIIEYNVTEKLTMTEYVQYKKQIDLAFRYKNEKGNSEDRNMEVWYIHGKAGSGKTTLAKCLCKMLKMPMYIASQGRNPMDNYQGQPAVILDDARPSDWKFNDFLKLTDNNTSSMIGCRFYNKHFYRCQLLIVTSCMPLKEWYTNLQDHDGEAVEQLTRRFTRDIEVLHTDTTKGIIKALETESQSIMIFDCPQIMKQVQPINLFSLAASTEKMPEYKPPKVYVPHDDGTTATDSDGKTPYDNNDMKPINPDDELPF